MSPQVHSTPKRCHIWARSLENQDLRTVTSDDAARAIAISL
ncbi:hypothetical protein [Fischerella thermalis]|nr:hypothetical protein [Fischerella thermalis]